MFSARGGFEFYQPSGPLPTSGFLTQATNNILTCPYNATLSNWKTTSGYTVEYWAYIPSDATLSYLASPQSDVPAGPGLWSGGSNYWSFGFSPTLQVQFYYWGSGKYSIGTAANAVTVGTWNNIAAVFTTVGTTFTCRIFINGVQTNVRLNNAGAYAATYSNTNGAFGAVTFGVAGAWNNTTNSPKMYVDELRISNVNRYTSNYTPASAPFTSDASTQLLVHFDGTNGQTTFTDSSGFARAISNPQVSKVVVSDAQGKF